MSGGIDYSKWDKFEDSSEEEEGINQSLPRVTRLEKPGKVTRSKDGTIIYSPSSETIRGNNPQENYSRFNDSINSSDPSLTIETISKLKQSENTKNGGEFRDPTTQSYVQWSQDRYEVVIRIYVDVTQVSRKDIRVKLEGAVPYHQRFSAISSSLEDGIGKLTVYASDRLLFEGTLPYPVHIPEDSIDDGELDWSLIESAKPMAIQLTPQESKFLQITLHKATPMHGVHVWWSQPFNHFPTIDVTSIVDRKKSHTLEAKSTSGAESSVWDEAHSLFRQKILKTKHDNA